MEGATIYARQKETKKQQDGEGKWVNVGVSSLTQEAAWCLEHEEELEDVLRLRRRWSEACFLAQDTCRSFSLYLIHDFRSSFSWILFCASRLVCSFAWISWMVPVLGRERISLECLASSLLSRALLFCGSLLQVHPFSWSIFLRSVMLMVKSLDLP